MTDTTDPTTEPVNLDEWLKGATTPQRRVTLYGDGAAYGQFLDIKARFDATQKLVDAEAAATDPEAGFTDDALDATGHVATLLDLEQQLREVTGRLDASGRLFVVRGLTGDELNETLGEHPTISPTSDASVALQLAAAKAADELLLHRLALAMVTPAGITVEKLRLLRAKVGDPQFALLVNALSQATGDSLEAVGFTPAHLPRPSTDQS